jgi:hypothetical protein
MVSRKMAQHRADHVFAALLNGSIQVNIDGYYSLDNVEKADARIENRGQVGKWASPFFIYRSDLNLPIAFQGLDGRWWPRPCKNSSS